VLVTRRKNAKSSGGATDEPQVSCLNRTICHGGLCHVKISVREWCLSRTQVFECFKRFKEGVKRPTTIRAQEPPTSTTDDNIENISKFIRGDRRRSIRALAERTGMDKESVRFCMKNLTCTRFAQKWCPNSSRPSKRSQEGTFVQTF